MTHHQVTYTNRRGTTQFLCRRPTKKGNYRYYFAKRPTGEPVYTIPEGYEIRENVNGIVSLAKPHKIHLLPEEIQAVERALAKKDNPERYRLSFEPRVIVVHEAPFQGRDLSESFPFLDPRRVQKAYERCVSFSPVLRFRLLEETARLFRAERMGYRAGLEGWLWLAQDDSLENLADRLVPLLGSDALFEIDFY